MAYTLTLKKTVCDDLGINLLGPYKFKPKGSNAYIYSFSTREKQIQFLAELLGWLCLVGKR